MPAPSQDDDKPTYKSTRRRLTRAEWFAVFGILLGLVSLLSRLVR